MPKIGSALRLVRASVMFRGLPLRPSDVVRAVIAPASIARQNIASAVAIFERVILAVPIHIISACLDHRAPWSLCALCVAETEAYRCKSSGSPQNRVYHHLSTLHAGVSNNTKQTVAISVVTISFHTLTIRWRHC